MEYDLHNNIKQEVALNIAILAATANAGLSIDTAYFGSLEYIVTSGTITTGDFTATLEESETGAFAGEEVAVDSELVLGNILFSGAADSNTSQRIGSVGKEQFQRIVLDGANTPNGQFSVVAVLGVPQSMPTEA